MFSPLTAFTITRLLFSSAKQSSRAERHLDFQKTFPHGELCRPVYIKLPKQVKINTGSTAPVLKLSQSLFALVYAAKQWYDNDSQKFLEIAFHEWKSAPYVLKKTDTFNI